MKLFPKSLAWRLVLGVLAAAVLLVFFYTDETRSWFDLNSAQTRLDRKICGILVSQEIKETGLSKMIQDAGIASGEPRWVKDNGVKSSTLFSTRYHPWGCCGMDRSASFLASFIRNLDATYQKTGDEKYFVSEDARKRYLLFALKECESRETNVPIEIDEFAEFMNQFREPQPE